MILSKEIAVWLNLTACKLKLYGANMLRNYNIDLTPEQFLLIDLLWNNGPMSQQQMADMMQKDKNSITKLADALEAKGFITRERDSSDRRSNKLIPTEKAQALKDEAKEKGISILDTVLEGISVKEQKDLVATLKKLSESIDKLI